MTGEGRAGPGAGALHHVEDTGRQAGVVGDVGQQRRGERRPLRRLEHDGVARRERRADPPGGQHERRVPGGDDRSHAGRVIGDAFAVAADLAVSVGERLGVVGEVAEVHRHPGHDAAPVRAQQGAVVPGLDPRQVLAARVDAVGDPPEDRGPVRHRQSRPRREGGVGRGDRPVDLGGAAGHDLTEDRLVDGGDVGERGGRRHPLATDPMPGVDPDTLGLDRAHACVTPPDDRCASVRPPFQTTPTWR
jgi:hypothetical protein